MKRYQYILNPDIRHVTDEIAPALAHAGFLVAYSIEDGEVCGTIREPRINGKWVRDVGINNVLDIIGSNGSIKDIARIRTETIENKYSKEPVKVLKLDILDGYGDVKKIVESPEGVTPVEEYELANMAA